jgi:hypothetical protein
VIGVIGVVGGIGEVGHTGILPNRAAPVRHPSRWAPLPPHSASDAGAPGSRHRMPPEDGVVVRPGRRLWCRAAGVGLLLTAAVAALPVGPARVVGGRVATLRVPGAGDVWLVPLATVQRTSLGGAPLDATLGALVRGVHRGMPVAGAPTGPSSVVVDAAWAAVRAVVGPVPVVAAVTAGSPAAAAGLAPGDRITAVDGGRPTAWTLAEHLGAPGTVTLLVVRSAGSLWQARLGATGPGGDTRAAGGRGIVLAGADAMLPADAPPLRLPARGASSGLAAGLALLDAVTGASLTAGAAVAVTGVLHADGRVSGVDGYEGKAPAVRAVAGDLLVLPAVDIDRVGALLPRDLRVRPAGSLAEAVAVLCERGGTGWVCPPG